MVSPQEIHDRLSNLDLDLPKNAVPAGNYVPYVISGNTLYISGQLPFIGEDRHYVGRVGDTITLEHAQEAAKYSALNILSHVDTALDGDWSRLSRCLKLGGFVNCTSNFTDHPKVINGASDFLGEILGEQGRHTRFAVGVSSLPLGAAVEIDALFEIKP